MHTEISVVYDNPTHFDAVELAFPAHLDLARAVPGVSKVESTNVWSEDDSGSGPSTSLAPPIALFVNREVTASR